MIAGPTLTAIALLWLWNDAEREDLTTVRPTMLDFGRLPSPPVLRQPLTANDASSADMAAADQSLGAQGVETAEETALPTAPPPDRFDALFSRVTVLDATRLRATRDHQPLVVHLRGIAGVAFSDACEGTAGRWNCGARARADLARLIGPRAVGCIDIAAEGDDGESQASCWVGNRNLALFMVSRGWAEPLDPADPLLAPYWGKAKDEKLGRYGDGSLQPADPSED